MNAFTDWLVHPIFQRIGWTLVHSVWEGAAVALVVTIVLALMSRRSAAARYVVACVALVLMIALPVVTFIVLPGPIVARTMPTIAPAHSFAPIELVPFHEIVAPTIAPPTVAQRLQPLLPLCAALWLIGIGVISIRHVGGWLRVQRLRRRATPLTSTEWQELMRRICDQLGVTRMVTIAESSLVQVPSVIGVLKPIILLPACAMTGLTPQQLEGLIAHELAHVRRHDYLVNLMQIVIETLLFYHPAAWWISRRIRQERENCCDDLAANVCGNRVAYVQALAAMEELRMVPGELVLAARGGSLLPRVRRLLGVQTPRQRSWSLAAAIAVVVIALLPALVYQRKAKAENAPVATQPTTASTSADQMQTSPIQADDLDDKSVETTGDHHAKDYLIVGAITQPGEYAISKSGFRIKDAIAAAGGTDALLGKGDKAYVVRGGMNAPDTNKTRNLEISLKALASGDPRQNVVIRSGDMIVIPANGTFDAPADLSGGGEYLIRGNVLRPGKYPFRGSQIKLGDALNAAGVEPGTSSVNITRPHPDGAQEYFSGTSDEITAKNSSKNVFVHPKDQILVKTATDEAQEKLLRDKLKELAQVDASLAELGTTSSQADRQLRDRRDALQKVVHDLESKLSRNLPTTEPISGKSSTAAPASDPLVEALLDKKLPEVNFSGTGLTDAIDFLRDITLTNIFVNWQALESAGIDRNTPVTVQVRDVSVAKALQLVLDSAGGGQSALAFGVRSNVIVISVKQPDDVVIWNGHVIGKVAKPLVQPVAIGPVDAQMKEVLERQLPEVNFSNTSFTDAIDFLRDVTNTNFFVNWGALEAAGIDRNSPVSIKLRNVSFQTALEILLQSFSEAHLAYSVDQGVISITTASAAAPAASQTTPPARAEDSFDPSRNYTPDEIRNLTVEQRMKLRRYTEQHETTQPYRAVRIVVGPQKMTLEGKEVTWDQASETLKKLPDRASTVLEIAMASDQMTLQQHDKAWAQGILVAHQLGFKYASDVGVHPIGSKAGESSQAATTQPRK